MKTTAKKAPKKAATKAKTKTSKPKVRASGTDLDHGLSMLKSHIDAALAMVAKGEMPDLKGLEQQLMKLSKSVTPEDRALNPRLMLTLRDLLDRLARLSYGISRLQAETMLAINTLLTRSDAK